MNLGEAHSRYDEYVYRHEVIPGLPLDAYLDEDGMTISWNTRIHAIVQRIRSEKQKPVVEG